MTSAESSHEVSTLEKRLYYFGLRGNRRLGPKLVFRTSTDVFTPPTGPENDARPMQLLGVYYHNKLGQNNLWATIREAAVELLDNRKVQFTSVDLARFRWEEQNTVSGRETVTSRVTIWVGVLPDSTTSEAAFESSQDILQLLNQHDIRDVDVAYRESVAQPRTGPALLAPVNNYHLLKDVLDRVTTTLGLPIAGLKTPRTEGTLGFYFGVGEDLYGVTARHVLFPEDLGNTQFRLHHSAGHRKEVILMGERGFDEFLAFIEDKIDTLKTAVTILERSVATYRRRAEDGNAQAATDLALFENDLKNTREAIESHEAFLATMKKDWSKLDDRVIGHVVWAPPITGRNKPHGYTQDVCVIKLNKKKIGPNFLGNVIDLGTEINSAKFVKSMRNRADPQPEFYYPEDRLFKLRDILTHEQIRQPNNRDSKDDPVRFVIKRGQASLTTIGCLVEFESHERRYSIGGPFDSVEAAIYPYDNHSGTFSRGGDSGALIAGAGAEFVALLTGGTGSTESSDITYGTPMHWLWEDVIEPQFPGASLYFDSIPKE
ncbi:hypothetical protein FA95DRAFT_1501512 [Auriscalpium vulgare]|uniref:Uncharacterized protein n=1 Tax=Auriscalpium vulgare TaxID=40419 RepID=A0ACB8RCW9_9AGAM|nr:hypothetical protein FA95DRAFT_1501512 [Auriscalpium vulgare]